MQLREVLSDIPDQAGISASIKMTVFSGLAGIFSGIAEWNWPAIIASTVAIAGLAINFYFQVRQDRRNKVKLALEKAESEARIAESQARIKALENRCDVYDKK